MNIVSWIKIGIAARNELDAAYDARVHIVDTMRPHRVRTVCSDTERSLMIGVPLQKEIIEDTIHLTIWRDLDFDCDIGMGYSQKCNVLAICEIPHEEVTIKEWAIHPGKKDSEQA